MHRVLVHAKTRQAKCSFVGNVGADHGVGHVTREAGFGGRYTPNHKQPNEALAKTTVCVYSMSKVTPTNKTFDVSTLMMKRQIKFVVEVSVVGD